MHYLMLGKTAFLKPYPVMPRNPSVSIVSLVKRWLNSTADSYEVETCKELVVSIW